MRILILTHPRSGGFALLAWLSRELGYTFYHEPLQAGLLEECLDLPNTVVKEDISSVLRFHTLEVFVGEFDLVIFHIRENSRDYAISRVSQLERGRSHECYTISDTWLISHQAEIARAEEELLETRSTLLNAASLFQGPSILTTYEGVYHSGDDVARICEFVGLKDPQWRDMIHPKRRLQGGDPSLPPPVKKSKLL